MATTKRIASLMGPTPLTIGIAMLIKRWPFSGNGQTDR